MEQHEKNQESSPVELPNQRKKRLIRFAVPVTLILAIPSFLIYGPSLIRFKLIREPIIAAINSQIPGTISVSAARVSLARGIVELHDLNLRTSFGESLISADHLKIKLNPNELFHKKIHLTSLTLSKPVVKIGTDSLGVLNIISLFTDSPEPPKPSQPKKPFSFKIILDSIVVDSLRGSCFSEKPNRSVDIGSLSIHGKSSLFPIKAKFTIDGSNISYHDSQRDLAMDRINLFANGSDSSADSVNILVQTPKETIAVRGNVRGWFEDSVVVHVSIKGGLSLATLKQIAGTDLGDGTFFTDCRVDGYIGNPDVTGSFGYKGSSLAGTGINYIDLPVKLNNRIVSTQKGRVTRNDGTMVHDVNLTVGLQHFFPHGFLKPSGNINSLWYRGNASAFAPKIPETDLLLHENYLDLSIEGRGIFPEYLDFKSSVDFRTVGTQNGRTVPLKLTGSLAMKKQVIQLSGVTLALDKQQVAGTNGSVNLKSGTMNLIVKCEPIDLAKVKPFVKGGFPADGVLGGMVHLNGKFATPDIRFDLTGSDMVVKSYPLGAIAAKGMVSPNSGDLTTIGSVRGKAGKFDLDFTGNLFSAGTFTIKKTPHVQIVGTVDSVNVGVFTNHAVEGLVHGNLNYSGLIGAGSGHLSMSVDSVRNKQFMIPQISAELAVIDSVVTVEKACATLYDSVNVCAKGTYSLDGTYDLLFEGDTIEPWRFVPAIPAEPKILLVAGGTAKGSIKNPSADLTVTVPNLIWKDISIGTQTVRAILGDNRLNFSGQGVTDLSGYFDLKSIEYELNGSVNQFLLDPYFSAYGQKSLVGSVDAELFARGNGKGLTTATLTLPSLTIKSDTADFVDGEQVRISYGKNGLNIDTLALRLMQNGAASIAGTISPEQVMNLSVKMKMPMAIAERFTTEVDRVSGDLDLAGMIRGTTKSPTIEAIASVDSVSMVLTGSQQKIHGLSGELHFTDSTILLDSVSGGIDDGSFSAKGVLGLRNNRLYSGDIRTKLFNLPVILPETADLRFGGDLRFSIDSSKQAISGTIDLQECYYYQNINPLPKLDNLTERKPEPVVKSSSPLDSTTLAIRIVPRKNIFVDNNLAQFDIHPQLSVNGTVTKPLIEGKMDVLSGDVNYLNRKFTVKQGIIEFVNPEKNAPHVNLVAETVIDKWSVTLRIEGGVGEELVYTSTSNPPLQDNEIIALILTGKPTFADGVEINSSDLLVKQIYDNAREKFGVDVEVDLNNNSFKIGNQISRRVHTDYRVIDQQSVIKRVTGMLLKLSDRLNIRGYAGNDGSAGGEVEVHGTIR